MNALKLLCRFALLISVLFLAWNELGMWGLRVELARIAQQVERADPQRIAPTLTGKLVLLQARMTTALGARDPEFYVGHEDLLLLYRGVQMFQSVSVKVGTGTSERREMRDKWSQLHLRDSPDFQPQDQKFYAPDLRFGAYPFPAEQLDQVDYGQIELAKPDPKLEMWRLHNNMYYRANQPEHPDVGDLRAYFYPLWEDDFSVLAMFDGKALVPFASHNKQPLFLVELGKLSAQELIATAISRASPARAIVTSNTLVKRPRPKAIRKSRH
jgi:hypothetical protein